MPLKYVKPVRVMLKGHPYYTEKWVQEKIIEDPSILGLGELELKDVERIQPRAGRLDLLLRDPETDKRYEVELMLGAVDETHIIRALEYWDIERKRYPQYDHAAVIVAEEINTRFLNVIGLFNSVVPIVALQMSALQVGESILLSFTKVLDEVLRGDDDEDADTEGLSKDRAYWEKKTPPGAMGVVDDNVALIKEFAPAIELNYKQGYIGLKDQGRTNNFIVFHPKRNFVRVSIRIDNDQEGWKVKLDEAGIPVVELANKKRIFILPTIEDLQKSRQLLRDLYHASYLETQG